MNAMATSGTVRYMMSWFVAIKLISLNLIKIQLFVILSIVER